MSKKNYNLMIGVGALVAIIILVALVGYFVSRPRPVVIQGEAEAASYRISGKVAGRIGEFRAEEGDTVRKGDTLVLIDSPEIRSKIAEAEAARAAAVAQRNKAYNGAQREQITGAYELWQKALVGEEVMRKSRRSSPTRNTMRPKHSTTPPSRRPPPPRASTIWPCGVPARKTRMRPWHLWNAPMPPLTW